MNQQNFPKVNPAKPKFPEVDAEEVVYPRRIIVKFINDIGIPYEDGADIYLPPEKWGEIKDIYPDATLNRLYIATSSDRLQELDKEAQERDKTYEHIDFLSFFTISLVSTDVADSLLNVLSGPGWEEFIEYVYLEALPGPNPAQPQPAPANPEYRNGSQGYLERSYYGDSTETLIGGIDAEAAWPLWAAAGSGEGISFIVVEKAWDFGDDEWKDASNNQPFTDSSLIYGHNYSDPGEDPQHGTKVLGILAMQDNDKRGVGIAPDATGKFVSVWRDKPEDDTSTNLPYIYDLPNAVMKANENLGSGDVLLIECQKYAASGANVLHPVEMDPAVFAEIRNATARGIAVIEPAGNLAKGAPNTVNLDNEENSLGFMILNRADTSSFQDSGAIMVAGAYAFPSTTTGYPKACTNQGYWHTSSNYGSRVDCFAWYDHVYTTGGNAAEDKDFGGTSAASAIVAGAVILIQALAKAKSGFVYGTQLDTGHLLRQILTSTGTPPASDNPATNPIGVMPNLKTFIDNVL
jgi:hypothetical protein